MVKWTKPTVDTKFHIDFDWWEEKGHNFRVHLFSNLCKSCQERYKDYQETDLVDWIDDARLANRAFGAIIESDQPIVVERAMYWRGEPGRPWGWGGSNATAVKLQ